MSLNTISSGAFLFRLLYIDFFTKRAKENKGEKQKIFVRELLGTT